MQDDWAPQGVQSIFIYTREAHPGAHWPAHRSVDHKLAAARSAAERWGLKRPMYIDTLEGDVHRAYGCLPNMAWLIDRRGRIAYRANWTDARTLGMAVDQLLWEEKQAAGGATLAPFECDWAPRRPRNRPGFVRGLLEAGAPAYQEFVDAARASKWPRAAIEELTEARASLSEE